MYTIKNLSIDGFEEVFEVKDESVGLHAFIVIHNTLLGPGVGGTRLLHYPTVDEALKDGLHLAKVMTLKAAFAQTATGGAKAVILGNPQDKSKELLESYAAVVEMLGGRFYTSEDLNINYTDIQTLRGKTQYILGCKRDPSIYTAAGLKVALMSVCKELYGNDSLEGRTISIQGLGSVGMKLASHLFDEGARLIVTDIDHEKVKFATRQFNAKAVLPEEIYEVESDIFSPCATGEILNGKTIPRLKVKAVCGSANNQLEHEESGELLFNQGILYAPDFVVNAGGLISVASEVTGKSESQVREQIAKIPKHLTDLFAESRSSLLRPEKIATAIAIQHLFEKSSI